MLDDLVGHDLVGRRLGDGWRGALLGCDLTDLQREKIISNLNLD